MRIMSVCKGYPTQRAGGMLHVVQDRAEALASMGHDVHVVCAGAPEKRAAFGALVSTGGFDSKPIGIGEYINGVTIHYIDAKPCDYSSEFAVGCETLYGRLRPDVLHFDSFDRSRPWWSKLERSKQNIAVTMHGFGFGEWLTQFNLARLGVRPMKVNGMPPEKYAAIMDEAKILRETFSTVIGISRHEWSMLVDQYGVPLSMTKLVYNPIGQWYFDEPRRSIPDKPSFLCAAVSGQVERLFNVAKQAADKAGFELAIVNGKTRRQMVDAYDNATAVIVPSAYAQGYDLTIAEAHARGRVAIVSSTGSYLQDCYGREGTIVTTLGDVDDIVRAMAWVQSNRVTAPIPSRFVSRHHPARHAENWLEAVT